MGHDVVVAGGGLIGLAIAWRARSAGLDVVVVDPEPGRGASWAAAGMLAPVTEVTPGEEALLELNLTSARLYPEFVTELEDASGMTVGYESAGTLEVARDADESLVLEELARLQAKLGLASRLLGRSACRSLEPALSPSTRGGIFVGGDHSVDNRALVTALMVACERGGVTWRRQRVSSVIGETKARGVGCADGSEVAAEVVVLAAGCGSGSISMPAAARAPIRPVKGQLLQLKGADAPRLLEHTIRGSDVYIVPRPDGRVVVGATVEEVGFDERVTADAVFTLLRGAYELVPAILDLELSETVVGFRPGSPDNAPLLGKSALDGCLHAAGHYRNGVLLAPVTAAALVETIVTGRAPEAIAPFSPQRFSRGAGV